MAATRLVLCTVQRFSGTLIRLLAALTCASGWAAEPKAPSLLLGPADFARLQAMARTEPWAGQIISEFVQAAEKWPQSHVQHYGLERWAPPAEGGGWGNHYICPEHGAALTFAPGHNTCPICRQDYHGWPWDYVIYSRRHLDNARAVRDLGLAYRLTGRPEFAAKARTILSAYAALYPTLPIRGYKDWPQTGHRSGGRVTPQTLNESDWVVHMAFGYDLVRNTLPPEERTAIERDILRNASDVIARRDRSLGNWTARHNAAHLAVGLVLGDDALVELGLNAEFGFRDQLRRSVTAEGVWHEGSWGYHFYAMQALFLAREMAARAGLPMPEAVNLQRMLDAPLRCMLPDGNLPNFNDAHFTPVASGAPLYDTGFRLFGDRRYLHVVRRAPRTLESLLWGAGKDHDGELPELASHVMPETGFATLRAPGSDHTVAIKFGAHGGGHGHYDKLNFISFAQGRQQALDPGTQSYAYKTHKTWDIVTVAHNTVVVDERTQAPATGRLLEWHPGPMATAIRVDGGDAYPQARLERLLVHTARYTLDVFTVISRDGAEHRYDWVYHNAGRARTALPLTDYAGLPADHGYQHLANARATQTGADWDITFAQPGSSLRVRMLGQEGTTVVAGAGLGPDLAVPVPFVMARRRGTGTRFVAVLEPHGESMRVKHVRLVGNDAVEVETTDGTDHIRIAAGHYDFTRKTNPR